MELCSSLATLAVEGLPLWDIKSTSLPITYGRFQRQMAKSFSTMDASKGLKHSYMYNCDSEVFKNEAFKIAQQCSPMELIDE